MLGTFFKVAGSMVRWLVFYILLLFNPLANLVLGLVAAGCAVSIILCLVIAPHQTTPMLLFFTVGLACAAIRFSLEWAIMLLAPEGFVATL